jgi:hypothetical protein
MKIIEALKNLKTIQKRIEKNCEQIKQYCAYVSVEAPVYETPEKQQAEVGSLIQANLDLEKEYLRLKKAIENTNLNVVVTIAGKSYTITELISLKRVAGKFRTNTYQSLNPQIAMTKLNEIYRKGVDANNPAKVISLYAEADKNKALREWDDFLSQIDGKLEVVNAETELAFVA